MVYQYRVQHLHKAPAQVAGEICEQLEKSENGLSPKTLLDASRPADAPLHGEFEWDDDIAAEKYREEQARCLIKNLRVVAAEVDDGTCTRAFVNVVINGEPGRFHNVRTVLEDDTLRERLMQKARKDCEMFIEKYKNLQQLSSVIREMRKVVEE